MRILFYADLVIVFILFVFFTAVQFKYYYWKFNPYNGYNNVLLMNKEIERKEIILLYFRKFLKAGFLRFIVLFSIGFLSHMCSSMYTEPTFIEQLVSGLGMKAENFVWSYLAVLPSVLALVSFILAPLSAMLHRFVLQHTRFGGRTLSD